MNTHTHTHTHTNTHTHKHTHTHTHTHTHMHIRERKTEREKKKESERAREIEKGCEQARQNKYTRALSRSVSLYLSLMIKERRVTYKSNFILNVKYKTVCMIQLAQVGKLLDNN